MHSFGELLSSKYFLHWMAFSKLIKDQLDILNTELEEHHIDSIFFC